MVERGEIERSCIACDHEYSSFFATNAASCSMYLISFLFTDSREIGLHLF